MRDPKIAPALVILAGCLLTATVVAQQNPPGAPPGQPQQPQPKRGLKVAVVDIGILFRDYKRKEKLENAVNVERDKIRKELEKDQEDLRRMRSNFDKTTTLVFGSEAYLTARDEMRLAQQGFELKQERLQAVLKKRVEELTLQVLTELERTIRAWGDRNSYDLILKSDDQSDGQEQQGELAAQFQERIFRAQISDILYHSSAVDVTDQVKVFLNSDGNLAEQEKWEAQQRQQRNAPPPAPPGPTTGTPPPPTPPK